MLNSFNQMYLISCSNFRVPKMFLSQLQKSNGRFIPFNIIVTSKLDIQFIIQLTYIQFINYQMNPKDRKRQMIKMQKDKGKAEPKMLSNYLIDREIGAGVSSRVYSAINIFTGERVAIKKIKNFLQNKHESLRILREVLLFRKLKHPNIINLKQIILEDDDPKNLSLVLEYVPIDVKKIFKSMRTLSLENIKRITYQILLGLRYCQECQVLHRDLKPENVLTTQDMTKVKLCDFGLARPVIQQQNEEDENQMKPEEDKPRINSHLRLNINHHVHVSSRWYRAPELIILERKYSNAIDIWSVGCILGELMTMTENFVERRPLFIGKACYPLSPPKTADMNYQKINDFPHSVYDQLSVIFNIIGTPEDIDFISDERARNYIRSFGFIPRKPFKYLFKTITPEAEDFLLHSLEFNPNKRMTITQALNHSFFDDIREDYLQNLQFKGEPINMELEGIEIPQIRELIMQEFQYYQKLQKQ